MAGGRAADVCSSVHQAVLQLYAERKTFERFYHFSTLSENKKVWASDRFIIYILHTQFLIFFIDLKMCNIIHHV